MEKKDEMAIACWPPRSGLIEEDYKKKKAKIQESLLEVQKQRRNDFAKFVSNQARAQAFKMAMMGYQALKEDDPEEAACYKQTMRNIVSGDDRRCIRDASSHA